MSQVSLSVTSAVLLMLFVQNKATGCTLPANQLVPAEVSVRTELRTAEELSRAWLPQTRQSEAFPVVADCRNQKL